ncbi:hypothetical protein GCM10022252_22790 [Streptosporangium oxazolinicum]|uniref:Uncharacterized protein n=1 Tax=Streptosporangium oxazolinicum TaxID=909287 RepID=A0ABP8AQL6_9ACTN
MDIGASKEPEAFHPTTSGQLELSPMAPMVNVPASSQEAPRDHHSPREPHPGEPQTERDEYEHPDEYDALRHVTSSIFGDSAETSHPGKFSNLADDPHWVFNRDPRLAFATHDIG